MIKLLSWNIRQGGGSRVSEITKFIDSQHPSILVLSEYQNNKNGISIRNQLLRLGFNYQFVAQCEADINSVLIASIFPCNSRLFHTSNYQYQHGVISVDFEAFNLYGVYLPHKKKHKLFDLLQSEITQNQPAIICGDFNTGENFIDQKEDSFWYTDELKKLKQLHMIDAFRHLHGDVKKYSWYSHQGNGYRYDHTFVHQDLVPLIETCEYLDEARVNKISDHSPMILTLKPL